MSVRDIPDTDRPIKHFVDNYYGTNPDNTQDNVEQIVWEGNVSLVSWLEEHDLAPEEVTEVEAKEFLKDLRRAYAPETQHQRASVVSLIYSEMCARGYPGFNANPFRIVLSDHDILDEVYDSDTRIYEKSALEAVLKKLSPMVFGVFLTELKTTRRVGGTLNLDLYDVHLEHPGADWTVHEELRGRPDHLHFSPRPQVGEKFRGEVRYDSAKTQTVTVIPIDRQLKDVLIWLLSMRKSLKRTDPVFTNLRGIGPDSRLRSTVVISKIEKAAKEAGYWYEPYDSDNIRSHYPRHWTTTKMNDRVPSTTVKYMRGDKPDTSDDYNHWSPEKAEQWLANIPQFDLELKLTED